MAWSLPTNFTNADNVSTAVDGIGSLFEYAWYATNNAFGLGIVLIIFLMSFGATSLIGIGRAFASASFITLIFALYFTRIGALSSTVPFILIAMTIVGFFWAKSERSVSY